MLRILRTTSTHQDFLNLVKELDTFLAITDGEEHDFYNQYNGLEDIKHVILIYKNNTPVACGAIKSYDNLTMEIKRMFTLEACRGEGLASKLLIALEVWAKELSYKRCILETGVRQTAAIRLYEKNGYKVIDNYGQYTGAKNSLCFEKLLNEL